MIPETIQHETGSGCPTPDCSALVEAIIMYRTTDGKTFHGEASAIGHQEDIEEAKRANEMLDAGESVGAILRACGRTVADEILDQVTKESKLVVEYWQCRDTPGYQPRQFEPRMRIYVAGDAGSWSGPYGGVMTTKELAGYARDRRSILGQNGAELTPSPAGGSGAAFGSGAEGTEPNRHRELRPVQGAEGPLNAKEHPTT